MRIARRVTLFVASVGAGCGLLIALSIETRGIGSFDQSVNLETDRTVRAVRYVTWTVDPETRRRAEVTADPQLFEWEPATLTGERFTARVMCSNRSGWLRRTRVYHESHLVVLVDFADGGHACRVVEIPPGCGRAAVVMRLR